MEEVDSGVITSCSGLLFSFAISLGLLSVVGFREDSLIVVVEFSQLGVIDFGSLDDLNLSNSDILDGVDGVDFSGDFLLHNFGGEEVEDLGGVSLGDFLRDDFVHASPDFFLLGAEGIIGLLFLVV